MVITYPDLRFQSMSNRRMTSWKSRATTFLLLVACYGRISAVSAFFLGKSHHDHRPFERDQVILGLRGSPKAVEQLDPVSGEVIQSFKSMSEASRQTGIPKNSISYAVKGIVRHAGSFLWRIKGDKSTPNLFESAEAILGVHKAALEQLDPITGEFIRSFESISEASQQTGIGRNSIRQALNGDYRHAGKFLWRRKGDKAIPNLFEGAPNTSNSKQVPVEQLDPVSGKVIQSFKSILEASKQTGIGRSSIGKALHGRSRYAGKFLWRQQGDQSTPDLLESPPQPRMKAIPVEQLDPVTGEVIQSFKSTTEAERQTGIGGGSIRNVLNGRCRHAGRYLWRRQGDPTTPELFESPPTPRSVKPRVTPVEQLDPVTREVIQSFKSVIEASKQTGITYSNINTALNGQQLHAGTYLWRRKHDNIAQELFKSQSTEDKGQVPLPVEQLDPYSGQVIQRFDSIEEASQKSKIPIVDIHKALSGKRRHAGTFLWKRQDDETSPPLFERDSASSKPLPVEQLDPVTGDVILSFESVSEASRQTGVPVSSIYKVLSGKRRNAGAYLWKRQDKVKLTGAA